MNVVKYFFVGGTAAVVDWTIFTVFAYFLEFNYLVVSAIGFIIATYVNYFLSIRFIFHSGARFAKKIEITSIYIVSAIGLMLHQGVLYCLVDVIHLKLLLAKITATGVIFIWNFGVRNYWIFAYKRKH